MATGTRVVTKSGETITVESDTYEFEDGVLYCYDDAGLVMLSVPQENVAFVVGCEMADSPAEEPDEAPPAPVTGTPDPGPGYRLIDKAVDKPQEGDEYWDIWDNKWLERVKLHDFYADVSYRRRVTPEPVCKREAFSGGGSPSPRECGVCGEGPCEKQPVESPDDWVTQDRVPYRKTIDQCRWNVDLPGVWYEQQAGVHHMHGYKSGNLEFAIRCRRKDLPPLPAEIHIGDSVVITESPKREDSWNGCRRTVQAKVKNGYVVGKVGEPISRIYLERELRVIPKPDGE